MNYTVLSLLFAIACLCTFVKVMGSDTRECFEWFLELGFYVILGLFCCVKVMGTEENGSKNLNLSSIIICWEAETMSSNSLRLDGLKDFNLKKQKQYQNSTICHFL